MLAMRTRLCAGVLVATVALTIGFGAAHAQDEGKPWAKGVSQADKTQATQLFREGNSLLKDSLFLKAAEKYRAAIKHWNHPAIHYNLALALMNLDQPLEVYEALKHAVQYGPQAVDQEKYDAATRYLKLVQQQIARVSIKCDMPGTEVVFDGKQVFTGPGKYESLVRIGQHTVVARKPGYVSQDETRVLGPGDELDLDVKMHTPEELTRYRRKLAPWKPWAVVGGGAAVLAVGGILHALARNGFQDYDDGIVACGGCVPPDSLTSKKSGAVTKQTVAFIAYGVGGAALAAGLMLAYINRAQPYRVDLEQPAASGGAHVSVSPTFNEGGAGFVATFDF